MAKKGGKVGKIVLGLFMFILVAMIGLVAAVRYDVAKLGTEIIGPYLVEVPVVNMILPEMPEEMVGEEGEELTYNFETVEEAIEILKISEKMLKESTEEAEILNEQITQLNAEVERLKIFEGNQVDFENKKAEFDQLIADNSAAIDFKKWYEEMNPENAAKIYEKSIQSVAYDEELEMTISIYQSMKASQAAPILEGMTTTRLEQVATIIKGLTAEQAADILGSMESKTAAKITSYIYPE